MAASTLAVMPIEPPTDEDRDRRAADLRERAELVLVNGWADYESVWSTGQVLGVRAALGDAAAEDAAAEVWAPTLWGISEADADARNDYGRTRGWFSAVTVVGRDGAETEIASGDIRRMK